MDYPDALPLVRLADCGCIVLADAKPIGYRWRVTPTGDVRTPVYACPTHSQDLRPATPPAIVTKTNRKRGA